MHEFSICESLVDMVVAEMKKLGPGPTRLVKAKVVVGKLRNIVPEFLQQAYEVLTRETPAEGSVIEVVVAPLTGKCEECGWSGSMTADSFRCAGCGSFRAELTGGKELYLEHIEVEQDEPGKSC